MLGSGDAPPAAHVPPPSAGSAAAFAFLRAGTVRRAWARALAVAEPAAPKPPSIGLFFFAVAGPSSTESSASSSCDLPLLLLPSSVSRVFSAGALELGRDFQQHRPPPAIRFAERQRQQLLRRRDHPCSSVDSLCPAGTPYRCTPSALSVCVLICTSMRLKRASY